MRKSIQKFIYQLNSSFWQKTKIFRYKKLTNNYLEKLKEELCSVLPPVTFEEKTAPLQVFIGITNDCNLDCIMCNRKMSKRPAGYIKLRLFERILKELLTMGIKRIWLHSDGEPLMHEELNDLLALVNKYGFYAVLRTNGQFPQKIKQLYKQYPRLSSSYAYDLSIDGATRDTYEFIRKGANFEELIKSLEVINEINGGVINNRISLGIVSVLCMTNIFEVKLLFDVFGKYCLPEHIKFRLINGMNQDQIKSFCKTDFPFQNLMHHSIPCEHPFEFVVFNYDGKVSLCCRDYDERLVIGNIQESSLTAIWNNDKSKAIRDSHNNPRIINNLPCYNCYRGSRSVTRIINYYIKSLISRKAYLTPKEFGEKIILFLNSMNFALDEPNKADYKELLLNSFKI